MTPPEGWLAIPTEEGVAYLDPAQVAYLRERLKRRMATLLVGDDLNNPGQEYGSLIEKIKSTGGGRIT